MEILKKREKRSKKLVTYKSYFFLLLLAIIMSGTLLQSIPGFPSDTAFLSIRYKMEQITRRIKLIKKAINNKNTL